MRNYFFKYSIWVSKTQNYTLNLNPLKKCFKNEPKRFFHFYTCLSKLVVLVPFFGACLKKNFNRFEIM
jgi:hypothetical protein